MNYLIDFKNTVSDTEIQSYLDSNGLIVLKTFNNFEKVFLIQSKNLFVPTANEMIESIIDDDADPLQLLGNIVIADQNFGRIVTDGNLPIINIKNNDLNWWKFYSLSNPDLEKDNIVINRIGINSTVYILDSGVNLLHPEFANTSVENLWSFNNNFEDTNGHGTAIASVISGQVCGLSNAKIKSVKIFENEVPTKQSDMLSALDIIFEDFISNNFNHKSGNAIVNVSWSISKNVYIENKIRLMIQAGIFFVVAAGNDGSAISDRTPACMPEVFTIGAYNNMLVPCDFSNYTEGSEISFTNNSVNTGKLDGWAPGEKIWVATKDGRYGYSAGTSIAAGIASAAIAYNLDTMQEPIYSSDLLNYFTSFALLRRDLLDLSDIKYAQSFNGIVTFREELPPSFGRSNPVQTIGRGFSGKKIVQQLFSPWQVSQIEILQDLPPTFEITPYGKLFGLAPTLSDEEDYRLISFLFKIKYLDNQEETIDFKFMITQNAEIETLGDPELDIFLAANCVPFGPTCILPSNPCINNCTMILVCDNMICPNPKQLSCTCIL